MCSIRTGPWAFEIIGMYIWLVAAAIPSLLILHRAGWRVLLAGSWALYLWYRVAPHALTMAGFETAFPLLAWQFCSCTASRLATTAARSARSSLACRAPRREWRCTPPPPSRCSRSAIHGLRGPSWLHLRVVSPDCSRPA